MIILSEVAQKLEKILNGVDSETQSISNPLSNPYYFVVETEGFHIDHIERKDKEGNFIPVFVSSMGGQFNPVKGLKQGSYSYSIDFYFPVRFKQDFFLLGDFLVEVFVGTILNYGEFSGKAVSNIGVPQFGEIQNLDFKEFAKWVDARYEKPIEVMESYMSMRVSLYLSNAAPGLIYGNDFRTSLSFTYKDKTFTLADVDFDGGSLQSNAQSQSEQEEGTNESCGRPFGTAYGQSIKIYPNLELKAEEYEYVEEPPQYDPNLIYYRKSGNDYIYVKIENESQWNAAHGAYGTLYIKRYYLFYEELLKVWFAGNIQEVEMVLAFHLGNLTYERKCYIPSIVAPIEKGQLFSLTMTFSKLEDIEVGE